MAIRQRFTRNSDRTENLKLTCEKCGEKIAISNEYGMFCKNMCGFKESVEAHNKIMDIFKNFKLKERK